MQRNWRRWKWGVAVAATVCVGMKLSGAQSVAQKPIEGAKMPNGTSRQSKAQRATFRNPLKKDGADPCLRFYNGWYYLSTTSAIDVRLRRARRLGDLATATDQVVWKDDTPSRSRDIWAAEFFPLESGHGLRWYLYFTASDGRDDAHHRLYVAESAGAEPLGPYTFKAQLQTDPDNSQYAIDGTVLTLPNGTLYFLWCGRPSPNGQGLYISRMENPWTLSGARTYLPADGFGSPVVREGPETLVRNGKVFLIYSSSGASTPDYKLGMLSADVGADLLNVTAWHQHPKPVFARVDQWGVFGPGHNFFFQSPDGREDWIAYHAKSGIADTYADRSTRAQPFTWNDDGTPNFGLPLPVEADVPVPSGEPRAE
jgi:GH43 family beta-xylosidase